MGKTLMGSTKLKKNVELLAPEQRQALSQTVTNVSPIFQKSLIDLMTPISDEQMQDVFRKTYVEPAEQALTKQFIPAIQQRFVDAGGGSSSALNQALAQAAGDLSTSLGAQYGQFLQNMRGQQISAASLFPGLLTNQHMTPLIQQQSGILGPTLGALGQVGAGYYGGLR